LNFNLNTWIGQVTTGHGAMILGPTLLAVGAGTIDWQTAVPFLAAGVIGVLWPENTAMQGAARTVASDVEALLAAYRTGLSHGAAGNASEAAPAVTPSPPHVETAMPALAMLVAAGLALTACGNQPPAQQAATETSIASGLLCLADASGKIVATATTSDPNALKAVNAAIAGGDVLLTDAACQSAIADATAMVPSASSVKP
jgi:hypothetical protein